MKPEKSNKTNKVKEQVQEKAKGMINKMEEKIDESTDKIYHSETWEKAVEKTEKATLSLFRKAGRWWGKL